MAITCRSSTPNIRIFYRFVLQKRKKHCPIVGKKMLNPNFCLCKKRNVKNTCVTNFSRVERKRYKLCSDAIAARGRQERGGNASLSAPCALKSSRGQCQSSSRLSRFKTRGTKGTMRWSKSATAISKSPFARKRVCAWARRHNGE